jgi:hypothetical protein
MNKIITIIILFLTTNSVFSQNRKNWTELDYINAEVFHSFQTDNDITGDYFVTISDTFNYYENPIVITNSEYKEIVRIEFRDNDIFTSYYSKDYFRNDTLNPLNPWLISLNPDYFSLVFECVNITSDHYVVKLNDNELGYIEIVNTDFKKVSIEDFVKTWTVSGFDFDRSTNPLRNEPNENGNIISNPLTGKYKIWRAGVLEIRGDWLKVKT